MKNEKGNTLLTVLLIITVFMIIFVVFTGLSYSSVKQNQIVEKTSKSVALAEMGVSYYQMMVQNIYTTNENNVTNQILSTIDQDRQKGALKTSDNYSQIAASLMKTAVQQVIDTQTNPVLINGNPNDSFQISAKNYYTSADKKITLQIAGIDNGKTTYLSTTINFAPVINGLGGSGSSSTITYTLPAFNSITQPTPNSSCINPLTLNSGCTQILINNGYSFNENTNNLSGNPTVVYSISNFSLDGNANKLSAMKIHANGDIKIGKNMNNISQTTMETPGNASFGGQLTPDSSTMDIGGNLNVDGKFELSNNTVVYVGGNANISDKLTVNSSSTLCVEGTLTVGHKQTITGNLILKGQVTSGVFAQKCGTPSTPPVTVNWGDKLQDTVSYNY